MAERKEEAVTPMLLMKSEEIEKTTSLQQWIKDQKTIVIFYNSDCIFSQKALALLLACRLSNVLVIYVKLSDQTFLNRLCEITTRSTLPQVFDCKGEFVGVAEDLNRLFVKNQLVLRLKQSCLN